MLNRPDVNSPGLLRRLVGDCSGAAMIELAFAVPVLTLILLGCFEATRYVLLNQKLERAAGATADLVAQLDGITVAQLADLFDAAAATMEPFDLVADGRIVVSSVYRPGSDPATVAWQRLDDGSLGASSEIGAVGADAALPTGFVVDAGENVIVAEVFYDYTPFFLDTAFLAGQLYHSAYNRPRIGNLTQITP